VNEQRSAKPKPSVPPRHEAWLALRGALLGVPAMLSAALASENHGREDAVRVARIAHRLHADAIAQLGEHEAEDVAGATLRLVRGRIVDIFGAEAWEEALRSDTP
jgi:hypothetical protein